MKYVRDILDDPFVEIEYKKKVVGCAEAEFWILKKTIEKISVTVVLRRIGNGSIHFFSIYQNKKPIPKDGSFIRPSSTL